MDSQLLEYAKDAEDTAIALGTCLSEIPQYRKDITGDIAELYAISSALQTLHEALQLSRYGRASGQILKDLEVCLPSLGYTLDDVRDIFSKSKRKNRLPGAFPGTPQYAEMWEDALADFIAQGLSLPLRLEYFRTYLQGMYDELRGDSCLQLCRVNRKDGQLDLWARLRFPLYERMVLFYNTAIAMKMQDQTGIAPGLEDSFDLDNKDRLEFST
ncbi:hypothetical protein N0V95_004817 [Ascochyta clinopodiicola]|nr:hypothetical protein N0V95_004817 [Ascochyta clinopodiicola]